MQYLNKTLACFLYFIEYTAKVLLTNVGYYYNRWLQFKHKGCRMICFHYLTLTEMGLKQRIMKYLYYRLIPLGVVMDRDHY